MDMTSTDLVSLLALVALVLGLGLYAKRAFSS